MDVKETKKTAKSGAGKGILIALAALIAVAAVAAFLYFVVFRTPLSDGIVGEWKLTVKGEEAFGSIAGSLDKYVKTEIDAEIPDVAEYFSFNEDGTYTLTVDYGSMIYSVNTAISSIVDHYAKHTDEFIEASGLDREYFEENGVTDVNMKEFLESLFQPIRENVAKAVDEFEKDERGNVIAAFGRYTVDGDTVKLTLGYSDADQTDFGYFRASVRYSVMTVKETDLDTVFKGDGVSLVKVENTER